MTGERGLNCPNRPNLRVFNENRRCRLWDGEAGVGGAGEGDGEMEYDEALERALDEGSDGGHDLHGDEVSLNLRTLFP